MRSERGLGGIIAMIIIVMLITIIALHFLFIRRVNQSYSTINQIANTRQRLLQMSKTLVRAGNIGLPGNNTYRIALINSMNYPIKLLGLIITTTSGNSYLINASTVPEIIESISMTLYKYNGKETIPVMVYDNVTQDIANGIFIGKSYMLEVDLVTKVSIDTSRTYFVFNIPFSAKGYEGLNQPSFVPVRKVYANLTDFALDITYSTSLVPSGVVSESLKERCGNYTETWLGPVKIGTVPIYGSPISYNILSGSYIDGDRTSLKLNDNNSLIVDSVPIEKIVFKLEKYKDNVLYADNFSSNPFKNDSLIPEYGNWSWSENYGIYGGGICQNNIEVSPSLLSSGDSYAEYPQYFYKYNGYIYPAYNGNLALSNLYILTLTSPKKYQGFIDMVFNPDSYYFYTTTLDMSSSQKNILYGNIWEFNRFKGIHKKWSILNSTRLNTTVSENYWYYILSVINISNDNLNLYLDIYNINGTSLMNPIYYTVGLDVFYVGLGTYNTTACFDMVVISQSDPRFITVYGPQGYNLSGWKIEIDSPNGFVANGTFNKNNVAKIFVLKEPIISKWTIKLYYPNGTLASIIAYNETSLYNIIGSNVYNLSINITKEEYYSAIGDAIDLETLSAKNFLVSYSFESNVTGEYRVLASPDNKSWFPVIPTDLSGWATYNSTNKAINNTASLPFVPSSKTIYLKIEFKSPKPFKLSIDQLNVIANEFVSEGGYILMVGCGETNHIDVYNITSGTEGPSLKYWFTIMLESGGAITFNGNTDFSYDPVTQELIVVTRGVSSNRPSNPSILTVYNTTIDFSSIKQNSNITPTLNSLCQFLTKKFLHPKVEVFNNIIALGFQNISSKVGSVELMTINESNGQILYKLIQQLPNYEFWDYSTSALDYVKEVTYFTLLDTETNETEVFRYYYLNGSSMSMIEVPQINIVGSAIGNNYLWFAIEKENSFVRLDLNNNSTNICTISYQLNVIGPGDRLEFFDNYLVLIEGNNTNVIYFIQISKLQCS